MSVYKLQPVLKDYIWGGYKLKPLFNRDNGGKKISESWEVSVHPDGESVCGDKTLSEIIKNTPCFIDKAENDLPVLIKYIDAAQNLSVQVHPADEYAQKYENDNGKTEMWYIISADDGAGIYCGFKKDVDKATCLEKIKDGTIEEYLNFIPVKAGDCFLIEAGTVHAIGAGCLICEIQQSSNVTYRVYDYNRVGADGKPRELHIEKALDVIDFNKFCDKTGSSGYFKVKGGKIRILTTCEYFTCKELILDGEFKTENVNSFTAFNVIEGEGEICGQPFAKGDSFIAPCAAEIKIDGKAKIIITTKSEEL